MLTLPCYSPAAMAKLEKAIAEVLIGLAALTGGAKVAAVEIDELMDSANEIVQRLKTGADFDVSEVQSCYGSSRKSKGQRPKWDEATETLDFLKGQVEYFVADPKHRSKLTPTELSTISAFLSALQARDSSTKSDKAVKAPGSKEPFDAPPLFKK
jgi:hypothetical protein